MSSAFYRLRGSFFHEDCLNVIRMGGPSSSCFCVRSDEGKFIYSNVIRIEDNTDLYAEAVDLGNVIA